MIQVSHLLAFDITWHTIIILRCTEEICLLNSLGGIWMWVTTIICAESLDFL